mgnify:CR=1 FL=1
MTKSNLSFVYVGSLSVRKAVLDIIEAIKGLPSLDVTIIGDGEQRAQIEKRIATYKLSNVKLLGTRSNSEILQLLADKDVFIMPSHYDGWGAVINEALTTGLYVVCTDKCGAKTLLEDRRCGIVYESGNITQLTKNLINLEAQYNEVVADAQWRREWAMRCISGSSIAHYMIDCIENKNVKLPWLD